MMNMKLIQILLITSLLPFWVFSHAISGGQPNDEVQKLKWIETASPENDAKSAIERKDYRLRAVYGYALVIPGVAQEDYEKVKKLYGIYPIEGTSDSINSSEHARLNKLATEYALKYNSFILQYKK
jgi:hypothetical protein